MAVSAAERAAGAFFEVCARVKDVPYGRDGAIDPGLGSGEVRLREVCDGVKFLSVDGVLRGGLTAELSVPAGENMIFCVTSGRMRLRCGFLPEWDIGDGSIICSAPGRRDGVQAELEAYGDSRFCLAMVYFSGSAMTRVFGEGMESGFEELRSSYAAPLVSAYMPETELVFREMCHMQMHSPRSERVLLLAGTLRAAALLFDTGTEPETRFNARYERMLIEDIPRRMMRDVARPPTIAELAREIGISPTKLKSEFREIHGEPIYTMFRRQRLALARELLETTRGSVRDIAFQCGYQSQGQFSEAFKREYGLSPSEFRSRSRKG